MELLLSGSYVQQKRWFCADFSILKNSLFHQMIGNCYLKGTFNTMIKAAIAHTYLSNSHEAGCALGKQLSETLQASPDAVILFAAPTFEYAALLQSLKQQCQPTCLIGCSSAGEFTTGIHGEGMACALALHSTEMRFAMGVGHDVGTNRRQAAKEIVASLRGVTNHTYRYRTALVLADALAGYTDDLIDQLTLLTAGAYQFFGGGAGDNAQFRQTPVFYDTEVLSDAVVALEILSNKPLGIGVQHGWQPLGKGMRATAVDGLRLISLNAMSAVEAFQEHAEATKQVFDTANPIPFFLHNLIGIESGSGYRLRVPLEVHPDGSILCASDIPVGAKVHFMQTTNASSVKAAVHAVESAEAQLQGHKPVAALFFDCVATRLRMGKEFGVELEEVQNHLDQGLFVGCNTHGQIARAEGQFSGFHNCTAVVCLIPE
jgi:hypothetical protein